MRPEEVLVRWLGLVIAVLLVLPAAAEEEPAQSTRVGPFLGIEGLDVSRADHRNPARLALLRGAAPLLGRTRPIAWAALEPVAPVMGGRHLRDWEVLDEALTVWTQAGVEVVLVLDPRSPWASQAPADSAWARSARAALPAGDAAALVAGATGASPPADATWDDWELLLRDLVERYDGDERADAEGARVRWVQVVERPTSSEGWIGSAAEYGRLLNLAAQGAQRASYAVPIVHGLVDFRTLGHAPWPDDETLVLRLGLSAQEWPPALVFEARRSLEFASLTLSLGGLFGAVPHAASAHLADERADVAWLRHLLDGAASREAEVWVGGTSAERHGEPDLRGARTPNREECRLRSRWRSTAGRSGDAERGLALDWLERGRAHDVVRSLAVGLAAGASRVFVGGSGEDEGIDVFVAPRKSGGWRRTPAWYALRQAHRLLAPHSTASEKRIGRECSAWRFEMVEGAPLPWVALVGLDADVSWAGHPHDGPVTRAVAVPLPDGKYVVEQTTLHDGEPQRRHVRVQGGGLRLELDAAPVWIYPDV